MLDGAKRLLIVPDGPLGGFPSRCFPPCHRRPTPQVFAGYRRVDWLARDYAITVLPSVGSLRALRCSPPRHSRRVSRSRILGIRT